MARPTKEESKIIATRNSLIMSALKTFRLSQSDIARVFRIPRNTVHTVVKARTKI